jgi:hypothetical protein
LVPACAAITDPQVRDHPGTFPEYAPRACDGVHRYLRARQTQSLAGGGGDGGGGGGAPCADGGRDLSEGVEASAAPLVAVRTIAVQGCVQVLSWVQSMEPSSSSPPPSAENGGGPSGSCADHAADGAVAGVAAGAADVGGDFIPGLIAALPELDSLRSIDVDDGVAVTSYSRTLYGPADLLAQSASTGVWTGFQARQQASVHGEDAAVQILWVWPPFLPVASGPANAAASSSETSATIDLDICMSMPCATLDRTASIDASEPRDQIAAEESGGGGVGEVRLLLVASSDSVGGCNIVLDEHVSVERGAATVVRVTLPTPMHAGVIRMVVAAPGAEHSAASAALGSGGGGGGRFAYTPELRASAPAPAAAAAAAATLATAPILFLPADVAEELYDIVRAGRTASSAPAGATVGVDTVPTDQDPLGAPDDPDDGQHDTRVVMWESFIAPLALDVAFLLDVSSVPVSYGTGGSGDSNPGGALSQGRVETAAAAAAAAAHSFCQLPLCLTAGLYGRLAGRTALAGLLAVEDSLR